MSRDCSVTEGLARNDLLSGQHPGLAEVTVSGVVTQLPVTSASREAAFSHGWLRASGQNIVTLDDSN